MTTKQIVKATDPNIISLKNIRWCDTDGYYFDPLTDQVYSSIAPKHSVNNLFPLTAEISNNGSKVFKLRGIRFSVSEIHDYFSNHTDTKLRAAYKKIIASKSNPTEPVTNSEKWVKVTDWRTLKIGDIIKTDDSEFRQHDGLEVVQLENPFYDGNFAVQLAKPNGRGTYRNMWVKTTYPLYKLETQQVSPQTQPSKGWVILEMKDQQTSLIAIQQRFESKIYHSESDADTKLKQLCDESPNTTFVKLEIKNFAITKTNPEFQLT